MIIARLILSTNIKEKKDCIKRLILSSDLIRSPAIFIFPRRKFVLFRVTTHERWVNEPIVNLLNHLDEKSVSLCPILSDLEIKKTIEIKCSKKYGRVDTSLENDTLKRIAKLDASIVYSFFDN